MSTCRNCDRTFSSPRGLEIHWSRMHALHDSDIVDFLNLDLTAQGQVLSRMEGDLYSDPQTIVDRMNIIYTQPMGSADRTRFKSALSTITLKDYRYVIDEEP